MTSYMLVRAGAEEFHSLCFLMVCAALHKSSVLLLLFLNHLQEHFRTLMKEGEICYQQMSMYMDLELFCLPPSTSQSQKWSAKPLFYGVSQVEDSLEILILYFQVSLWDENWQILRFDPIHFKIKDWKLPIAETNLQPFLLWVICSQRSIFISFSQIRIIGWFHIG